MAEIIGVVERLWRYPVKSTAGERLSEVQLDERGLAGDRLYAVRDADGRIGSGKNGRRFRRMDGLLRLGSRLGHRLDGPELLDPLGRPVTDPTAFLRAYLQRPEVELAREDGVPHLDRAPVSLVSTATLDWLRESLPQTLVDERRFRPNIVLRTPPGTRPFVEDDWLGHRGGFGSGARLRFTGTSERCAMTAAAQPGLPHAPELLRLIASAHGGLLDALAAVDAPGPLRVGDRLRLD